MRTRGRAVEAAYRPQTRPAFEYYSLTFDHCPGRRHTNQRYGNAVRDSFQSLLNGVSQTYGKPDAVYDFLRSGSIWKEPEDWMAGLLKEERTLAAYWTKSSLSNGIKALGVEAQALSPQKGYVTLTYEFNGWSAYLAAQKQKAATVF